MIEFGGPDLSRSRKLRNIQADPRVSFIVDDVATLEETLGPDGQRGRGIEVRGRAEIVPVGQPIMDGFSNELIRIHPHRILALNVNGPGLYARDVTDQSMISGRESEAR